MRRIQLASVAVRLSGLALLAAAGWTVNTTCGLVSTGLATLGLVYLPDGDM